MACKLGAALPTLPDPDRQLVETWMDHGIDARGRQVSAVVLAQALTLEGHRVGATTVKDHRGRRCTCWA